MTATVIALAWVGLAFFCGYVVGSILRERDQANDDEHYVEVIRGTHSR